MRISTQRPLLPWALLLCLLACPSAWAEVKTEVVPYEHDGLALKGYLAYDDALEGPRPGVLLIHEWWGQNDYVRGRAEELASLGYVAFALDMYGGGQSTNDPKEAGKLAGALKDDLETARARARAGWEQLKKSPRVDGRRTAVIGYCFGGTMALQFAYTGADLRACVSFHGDPLAPRPEDRIVAKVLVCHGAADGFVSDDTLRAFREAMHEKKVDWLQVSYGGAVHSFTNKGADAHGIKGVAYDAAADRRSWAHMRLLFEETLTP